MSGNTLNAILFLLSCLFDFYIIVLFMRLILAWVNADYHHPITQFVIKLTSPIVKPIKKFIPDIRGFESSTLVLILVVEFIKYFILTALSFGMPNIFGLLILAFGDAIRLFLETLSLALILLIILSWVQQNSPVYQILDKATSFITRPGHKVIPKLGGIDIVPMIAILVFQLLIIAVINPIIAKGLAIATGA